VVVFRRGCWRSTAASSAPPSDCSSVFGSEARVRYARFAELLISGPLRRHGRARAEAGSAKFQFMGFIYPCIDQLVEPCLAAAQPHTRAAQLSDGFYAPRHGSGIRASRTSLREHRGHARPYSGSARGSFHLRPKRAYGLLLAAHPRPPIRWCSWSQHASTARREARLKTTARPWPLGRRPLFSRKAGTSR